MKVIAELTGGFGNQLFAYACGYALAKKKGADLYINTYMADNGMSRELGIDELTIEYVERITYKYKRDFLNRERQSGQRQRYLKRMETLSIIRKCLNRTAMSC